jgi:hypothetical protein
MNREQKIEALISIDMDNLFTNHKELEHFVANVLRNGMKGWNNESDEVVNDVYIDIFEENE